MPDEPRAAADRRAATPERLTDVVRRLPGSWKQWQLPATVEGVHLLGVVPFVGIRLIAFFQLLLAILSGPIETTNALVYWSAVAVFVVEGLWISILLLRARSPVNPRLASVDVATMCLLLLAQLVYAPADTRLSTWQAWGFGVSLSTLILAGIGFTRWWHTIAASCALATCYLASVGPAAFESGQPATALANASGYLFNSIIVRLLWIYLLRVATEAEDARREAARLAREAEREAQMRLLHDGISLLQDLARPESLSPEQRRTLSRQALDKVWELRQFLADVRVAPVATTLDGILQAAAMPFKDLNPTVHVDLVRGLVLPEQTLHAIEDAVTTLLFNVRRHARAEHCHLHGDNENGRWEVVVRDDGVGFDPATTVWHTGLQTQVVSALHQVGADVTVWSEPGSGTAITMTGPVEPAP